MAEVEVAPAATAATQVKATKKKTTPKAKKVGPTVGDMIVKAVSDSKERGGISLPAIKKILLTEGYDIEKNNARVKNSVKSLLAKGTLVNSKGSGASGSFKISKEVKPAAKKVAAPKAKKPAVKKPATPKKTTPKKAKKPAVKSSSAKKASPKKPAPAKKTKEAIKKAVTKKTPTKKVVTKKSTTKSPKKAPKPAAKKSPAKKATKKAAPKKK